MTANIVAFSLTIVVLIILFNRDMNKIDAYVKSREEDLDDDDVQFVQNEDSNE